MKLLFDLCRLAQLTDPPPGRNLHEKGPGTGDTAMHLFAKAASAAVFAFLVGCVPPTKPVTTRNNELTHGNVQLNLKVGETTQTQVLEVFGAPNITSIDGSEQEVWTYQRHATVSQSSSSSNYWTIILAGGENEAAGFEQTQRTMTLIIKFGPNKIVSDFRSRSSEF